MTTNKGKRRRGQSKAPSNENTQKPGGKPLAIDDDALFPWRDSLVNLFVATWGHFGWTLRTATTRAHIVTAFSSAEIPPQWTHLVTLFVRETHLAATVADVHKGRRAIAAAQQQAFDFEKRLRPFAAEVYEAQHALQHMIEKQKRGFSAENWDTVSTVHRARLDAYAPLRAEADELDQAVAALRSKQDDVEAAVAQDELLSFLDKSIYKFNPRNLAHAVAGLPYIAWRHSFRRCGQGKSWSWPSPVYQTFELIDECANASALVFVDALRERIRALPASTMRETLSDNFYYLRIAVEETLREEPLRTAYPFRVFTLYFKGLSQARTDEDRVIASLERIVR